MFNVVIFSDSSNLLIFTVTLKLKVTKSNVRSCHLMLKIYIIFNTYFIFAFSIHSLTHLFCGDWDSVIQGLMHARQSLCY